MGDFLAFVLFENFLGAGFLNLVGPVQGRTEQMSEYIKKLRACIRWYIELEDGYLVEQEKLRSTMDAENAQHAKLGNEFECTSLFFVFI